MFEKLASKLFFNGLLKRPDISKAYAPVPESNPWYKTISKVHESLDKISELKHETLEITSHDNLRLKGIYYPNNSDVTVIFIHGYTSHAERESAFPGLFYLSLGYNVLVPYQRAHGLSEGKYITFSALEHIDMMKWIDKINEINPNGKIIIFGLSMGGEIALNLSDKDLKNVKCIIAESPNVSIEYVFKNISGEIFGPKANIIAEHAIKRFNKKFKCDVKDFESVNIVKNSKYPILLSAGSLEKIEQRLDDIKNSNPNDTEIIILPECNHGNCMYLKTEMYQNKIKEFINKYI